MSREGDDLSSLHFDNAFQDRDFGFHPVSPRAEHYQNISRRQRVRWGINHAVAMALVLLVQAPANAQAGFATGNIKAPRSSGHVYETAIPMDELKACVVRASAWMGRVMTFDANGSHYVEIYMDATFVQAVQSKLGFVVTDRGDMREVTAVYRHPFSARMARGQLKVLQRSCGIKGEAPPHAIAEIE